MIKSFIQLATILVLVITIYEHNITTEINSKIGDDIPLYLLLLLGAMTAIVISNCWQEIFEKTSTDQVLKQSKQED